MTDGAAHPEALWALLAGLVAVAVIHAASRIGGALATAAWCAAALVYGAFAFAARDGGLVFLGIPTPTWTYFVVVTGVGIAQIVVVVRAMKSVSPVVDDDEQMDGGSS